MHLTPHEDTLFTALIARDPAYEGFAFAAVMTTGVFCRLTCPARKPKRRNVTFFATTDEAGRAGFRPCKRCRPLDQGRPTSSAFEILRAKVTEEPEKRWTADALKQLGYDASTVRRAFKREYGVTFAHYARSHRLGAGVEQLRQGGSAIDAQLDAGYESASGFREAINKLFHDAPNRSRSRRILIAQWLETPLGAMLAVADDAGLHLLEFADRDALPGEITRLRGRVGPICIGRHPCLDAIATRLAQYFAGERPCFDVPVVQTGTPFEKSVWSALREIPVGETRSYGEIARTVGRPDAARAAARANGANQVAIVVPCHRIVGADGSLTGYGGKIWRKKWLLEHERRMATKMFTTGVE